MKHTRIVTRVDGGVVNPLVWRQLIGLFLGVKDGVSVIIEIFQVPQRRSAAQNDAFHAMIAPWARDEGHDVNDLKRDLLGTVFGWESSPLGYTNVPLKPSTAALTVEEFSELMERTVIVASSNGYMLQLPSEYSASKFMPEAMRR